MKKQKSSKKTKTTFESIDAIFVSLAELVQPPERMTVAQSAERFRYVNQPGAYVGPWFNHVVPYMVEPMNTFASLTYEGMIFVGPAQTGKTDALLVNTIVYSVLVDPLDMFIVCPSILDARDFSMRRVDRLHDHSEKVGAMLLPTANADNRLDKHYVNGMLLTLGWPARGQLAGKPIARVLLTDRDRMDDDVDGDGEPYDLAAKRTTTFKSYAMTVAESSPSRPITKPDWIARTPHEAPPCEGILKLYNRGDRRRLYWPCPHCKGYFEGMFEHLEWDVEMVGTNYSRGMTARMKCPLCSQPIHPDDRDDMLQWSLWVKDGQSVDHNGVRFGPDIETRIASFWLRGVAAGFVSWSKLVTLFLDASDEYERTGSEEGLRKFYNTDLGEPYVPKSQSDLRLPEVLKARAEKVAAGLEKHVPRGARFLIANVDVQKNMFVVCVFAIFPGKPFDMYVLDRFEIRKSKRLDHDNDALWVKPHVYAEDWDELIEHVIEKEYPLDDLSGRTMGIRFTTCDSAGREGATTKAYEFYRRLRQENKHRRFILTKGDHSPNRPRTWVSYPDTNRKDQKSGARGDIPVLMFNSNLLKDALNGRLDCLEPGKGMYRTPDWLDHSVYAELCVESRTDKGWENESHGRNEQWDLSYYCIGVCISEFIRAESMDWDNPPSWAAEWDKNDYVHKPEEEKPFANRLKSEYDFADLGKALA